MPYSLTELPQPWSELVIELLQKTTSLALGLFDLKGELLYANDGMTTLLSFEGGKGVPSQFLVNPSFEKLVSEPPRDAPVFEGFLTTGDGLEQSRSTRARVYRRENQLLVATEYDVAELDMINTRMTSMNREINTLQRQLIKEKTLLEQTLRELRETQAMLIHAEKMTALGQLVAGVAHEVNNPMGFVISNLYSLKESFSDLSTAYGVLESLYLKGTSDGSAQALEALREEHDLEFIFEDFPDLIKSSLDGAVRVKEIVKNLRTFSRLDEAKRKTVDIGENLSSTLSLADSELRKRDIRVQLELDVPDPLDCYPADLNQVFMNLIINAAQAMTSGGDLIIRARQDAKWVLLEFEDTGPGIPEDIRNKIFDPFFTTKPVGSGTGLGLSLAYQIITEKHKGSISVDSAENRGSCFRIKLPRNPE